MPDGDRFERSLRGWGWRSAYRLAAGGATSEQVTDQFTLEFPDIRRSCDDIAESKSVSQAEVKQRLLRLYRHYVDDWFTFSARARLTPLKVAA